MRKFHQQGFAVVEMVLILVIVGIIAFVAWRVIDAQGAADQANNTVNATTTKTEPSVTGVNKASDLDTLDKQLDETTVDDTTTSDLETQSTF
jgi:competence protein ComGC